MICGCSITVLKEYILAFIIIDPKSPGTYRPYSKCEMASVSSHSGRQGQSNTQNNSFIVRELIVCRGANSVREGNS